MQQDNGTLMPVWRNGRILPPEKSAPGGYIDDFRQGVDPARWRIADRKWGGLPDYQGCLPENISYTEDGILLLKGQGLYSKNRPLSGAAIVSAAPHGAGRYSVAMKVLPRLGVCNAMWTYFQSNGGMINHEIDIELPGHVTEDGSRSDPGYHRVLNTNWVSTMQFVSNGVITDSPANDGNWHLYTFDWHIKPAPHIDFYVDGKLTTTITEKIPFKKGLFWVGVWFPRGWCGVAEFEQDYMMVDWVSYCPFDEETEDVECDAGRCASLTAYPQSPVAMPETDLISNRDFSGNMNAYTLSVDHAERVAENGKYFVKLNEGGFIRQGITAIYGGMQFLFKWNVFCVKGKGTITLTYYNFKEQIIHTETAVFDGNGSLKIIAPEHSRKLVICVSARENAEVRLKELSLKLDKKEINS